ncbi:MAG TPA: hypothetical protein VF411_00160 [Bacteroidia bacterium]
MKKIIITLFVLGGGLFVISCAKDDTLILKPIVAPITRTVSFAGDIEPIFVGHCAKTGCHGVGGQKPDLSSAANAYKALVPDYVNTATPASSSLYMRLTGAKTPAMPFDAPASDPSQINELVLAWITQGAKNN